MDAKDSDTITTEPRRRDDVAAMIGAALDAADEETLRRVAKAALVECGRQRTNAFRVGLPDSAPYRAIVGAAEHVEEALIHELGGWDAVERGGAASPRARADQLPR